MCEARRKERVPPRAHDPVGQEIQLILTEDADEALKAFQELEPNLSWSYAEVPSWPDLKCTWWLYDMIFIGRKARQEYYNTDIWYYMEIVRYDIERSSKSAVWSNKSNYIVWIRPRNGTASSNPTLYHWELHQRKQPRIGAKNNINSKFVGARHLPWLSSWCKVHQLQNKHLPGSRCFP